MVDELENENAVEPFPPALIDLVDAVVADDVDVVEPDRSTWCTPRWLAERLGRWDLDPCTNERSHIISDRTFDFDRRGQDGLVLARYVSRRTRVFCNPPYRHGQVIRWIAAYAHTRFCYLLRFDPSTEWFEKLYARTELLCVLRERINFEAPPGVDDGQRNPFPHALYFRHACDAPPAIIEASYVYHPDKTIGAGQWPSVSRNP